MKFIFFVFTTHVLVGADIYHDQHNDKISLKENFFYFTDFRSDELENFETSTILEETDKHMKKHCQKCDKYYSSDNFQKHIETVHFPKAKICCPGKHCKKKLSTIETFIAHLTTHPNITFKCPIGNCSQAKFGIESYRDHAQIHNNLNWTHCHYCKKEILVNNDQNIRNYIGNKIACKNCLHLLAKIAPPVFSKNSLDGLKNPLFCPDCGKFYSHKKNLDKHLLSHKKRKIDTISPNNNTSYTDEQNPPKRKKSATLQPKIKK